MLDPLFSFFNNDELFSLHQCISITMVVQRGQEMAPPSQKITMFLHFTIHSTRKNDTPTIYYPSSHSTRSRKVFSSCRSSVSGCGNALSSLRTSHSEKNTQMYTHTHAHTHTHTHARTHSTRTHTHTHTHTYKHRHKKEKDMTNCNPIFFCPNA